MRGQGRTFRRGETWWIAYHHRGAEYRESAKSTKEADANRLLKRRLGEMHANTFVGPSEERLSFSQLLDNVELDYKLNGRRSLKTLKGCVKNIRKTFKSDRAIDLTETRIEKYKADRLAEGVAPATVNRELEVIRRAFRLAVKRKLLRTAPNIELLEENNARQGFVSGAEFEKLCAGLKKSDLQDFARFGFLTAWRKGEIATLSWADVDLEGRVIRLRPEHSKSGRGRVIALEGDLWDLIQRRIQRRQVTLRKSKEIRISPTVFHRGDCKPVGDIRKVWDKAATAAGLAGLLFHDLRRSGVRNMVRSGVSERTAMAISGHLTRAIFDRYDIVNERDIREAVLKTQDYLRTQGGERKVIPLEELKEQGA